MAIVYVYILTDKSRNAFFQGICTDLKELELQSELDIPLFDSKLPMNRLVYFEKFNDMRLAQQRFHLLQISPRVIKEKFIRKLNPNWIDLFSLDFSKLFTKNEQKLSIEAAIC